LALIEKAKICDIGLYVRPVSCFLAKPPAARVLQKHVRRCA
jgi:hypothetical protein